MSMVAPGFWKIQSLIGPGRAVGGHEVLQRERQAAGGAAVELQDRRDARALGLVQHLVELGQRGGRLGHADLGGELLVVEDAGHAEVEPQGVQGALAARPAARAQAQLLELRGRPLVPAEGLRVAVEVLQQVVLDQLGDLGQPHQVGRVVRQHPRGVLGDDRELVLADVPRDVRVLLGELGGQRLGQREAGLEVAVHRDRRRAAGGRRRDRRRAGGLRLRAVGAGSRAGGGQRPHGDHDRDPGPAGVNATSHVHLLCCVGRSAPG